MSCPQLQGGAGSTVIDVCSSPLNGLICPVAKSSYCVWVGSGVTDWPPASQGRLPTWPTDDSVHQIEVFPGPSAMPSGLALAVGNVNWVMIPCVVIRPRMLAVSSVNQRLPSAPATMSKGHRPAAPSENSVITPLVVIRPILLEPFSVNQMLPSGPSAMPQGIAALVGTANSVIEPPVVTRAMRSPADSVTQRLPSDPAAIRTGRLPALRE